MTDKQEQPSDFVVVARNPAEMQVAQHELCVWAADRVVKAEAELAEAEGSLEQAKKSKWRQTGFKTHVRHAIERLKYYRKVRAALEDGYVIVPNFDLDIFAIRTTKTDPKHKVLSSTWHKPGADEFEQDSNRPAMGMGQYYDAWPDLARRTSKVKDKDGKITVKENAHPKGWRAVDFPYKLAKPQILSDTSKAMARKIFDKIGITPHRRVRKQDPMIIGQIVCKGRPGQEKHLSFLIAWWVDQTDLEV